MADLDTDVAGRVRAAHHVQLGVLQLREGRFALVERDVHRGYLGQGGYAGLEVSESLTEDIIGVGCQGSGVECGDENCLGRCSQGGHHAVGALDEGTPEAALEEQFLDLAGVLRRLLAKVHILLFRIGLNEHCQQFSLGTSHDLLHRAADRRGEQNLGVHFVGHHRGACEHGVALLHQQSGDQTVEVGRLNRNNVRAHGFDDDRGCSALHRNVQTLLQSEIV